MGGVRMARYVFSINFDGKCVYYIESTSEQDKEDAGLTAFGGSGYLDFWHECKEVVTELRSLAKAVKGMKYLGELVPDIQHIADGGDIEAVISDLDYDEERRI
jgi:hypothetical protein